MFKPILAGALAAGALFMALGAGAQTVASMASTAPEVYASNNYADRAAWLCWPGRADACASDLTTTVVKADGSTSTETFKPDPNAKIDCFYVYPTVSHDPGAVATMNIEPEETNVVIQQAARLAAHCRLYAPMYRQFTLTALVAGMSRPPQGAAPAPRPMVGYNDVRDAWNYYLAHENHGRGVVLVGHSQGSGVLTQLIRNEIDGKPSQKLLVSALLMGTPLPVPVGKDVGGAFQHVPLCHSASQLGCVIAYSSFRETSPPPANSRFGRPRDGAAGMEAACSNPAALGGGSGPAHAYFGASLVAARSAAKYPWLKDKPIDTPFVSVPGLITAHCVDAGGFNYLAIHLNADPKSPRASNIPGDLTPDWGLHLIDANLFMGNLVDIVGDEAQAWEKKR